MKAANVCIIGLVFVVSVSAEPLFEGQVRLESGEPVADAQVRIFDLSDLRQGAIARAMTDGTGYFALPLAALTGRALPARFALGPNYPNPFNPSTIIPYQLAASAEVRLEVFNLLGQRITTLVDGERAAGFHTATWHATDGAGRAVGAGVYIYRMTVGVESQTGRMVLLDGQAGVSAGGSASVMPGASGVGGSDGADAQVYGLIVSGSGLVPYVDPAFRVEGVMAPVELVVSSGLHSAGKATDDDCAFCDLFGTFNDQQEEEEDETPEEEAETDSTSSEGGPDLIVQSPSVSAVMLTPGQEFTLNVTVHNQGDEQAAATMLHYYRSNNSTITSSDTEVGTDEIGTLDASATSAASIALTAPTSVSAEVGIYYGACVASVRGESDTDNNCSSAVKITLGGQEATEEETTEEEEETTEEEGEETPEEEDAQGTESTNPVPYLSVCDRTPQVRDEIVRGTERAGCASVTKQNLAKIRELGLWQKNITALKAGDFTGLTNLTKLNLYANDLTDISPLRGLTKLELLVLGANDLSDVSPLSGLTKLTELYLYANDLTDISPLRGLTKLELLWLGSNDLTDISPLRGLTNLTGLDLQSNYLTDISSLRGLTNLTWLDLRNNDLSDVSPLRRGLTKLELLLLEGNYLTDISPLRGLTNLTGLDLRVNLLNDSSINDHIPALESRGVTVLFDSFREKGDFDIELVFLADFTQRQKRKIEYAARRWMSIIKEDLPDYEFAEGWSGTCGGQSFEISSGERIDDLRIYITSFYENSSIGGWAAPYVLRETSSSLLPVVGCMGFNLDDDSVSLRTALHEIGHVLGIGTYWESRGFLQDPNGDPHFNGPRAIAAFNDAGGRNYTSKKVPVDSDLVHWRVSVLWGEVMDPGNGYALSAITIQALADLGYGVDVSQADPYTLPGAAGKASAKIAAAEPSILGVDIIQADVHALLGADPHWQGRIGGLPLLPGDDRLRGRLESAEWIGGRGFDLRNDRLMGRLAPSPRAMPKPLCGVDLRREPIYVIDPQGRIIRTIGD